jgi:tetratricopeptide (TPR) repeat protein
MWSKGFGAEETNLAFSRARELAAGIENPTERFDAYYGLWIGAVVRGELRFARQTAETFRDDAKRWQRTTEEAVACRAVGLTCLDQGEFIEARASLEQSLSIYGADLDREAKFRFGIENGVGARAYLAHTCWALGEAGRARKLMEEAIELALRADHAPTLVITYFNVALFEMIRGDPAAARRAAESVVELSRKHELPHLFVIRNRMPWLGARSARS